MWHLPFLLQFDRFWLIESFSEKHRAKGLSFKANVFASNVLGILSRHKDLLMQKHDLSKARVVHMTQTINVGVSFPQRFSGKT